VVEIVRDHRTGATLTDDRIRIQGNVFIGNPPPVPGGPPDGQTAVRTIDFTFPASSRYITTPPSCLTGQWTSSATFTFADGSTQHVSSATPCTAPAAPRPAAITDLRISPSSFPAAGSGGSIPQPARGTGASISYRDSQPASTMFTVLRARRGVRRGTSCVKPRTPTTTSRRCTRYVKVGSFRHADRLGTNRFRFTGRVGRHKLRPGRYRLKAVPRFGGQNGHASRTSVRIVS
jgi:hypothetical protein